MYINDINVSTSVLDFILFADDSLQPCSVDDVLPVLTYEFSRDFNWLTTKRLTLNIAKLTCCYLIIEFSDPIIYSIFLNDAPITSSSLFTSLT